MINFFKKRGNLILGLLLAFFVVLIVMQTISVTGFHDVNIKDFSIMRTVSVPYNSDVKECLSIFKDGIGEAYSFDNLYSTAYVLFIFGIVSMALCFKKYNKSIFSKVIILLYSAYSLYALTMTANLSYILKNYDSVYILKLIVAVLIFVLVLLQLVLMLKELAANGWFEKVNVHAFLNGLSAVVMLLTTVIMFIPFVYTKSKTASIMGYALLPENYKNTFDPYLESNIANFQINYSIFIPVVLFVIAILASFLCIGSHKNSAPTVLALAWGVLGFVGFIFSAFLKMDPKMILYIILFAAVIALSVINLVQFRKVKKILG